MVSIDKMEFKNIPIKFISQHMALKSELTLEKINHGKCQSYIDELEDRINSKNEVISNMIRSNEEKEALIKQLQNTIKQLRQQRKNGFNK